MKAAIIACGIGHEAAADHGCDIAIGINHAAGMYPCNWFCFCDVESPELSKPIGMPRWFTNTRTANKRRNRGLYVPVDLLPWEFLDSPPVASSVFFSSVWALLLAKWIGATEIVGIGLYTVNFPNPVDGEAARWVAERRVWNQTLQAIGMEVKPYDSAQ